jgi:hypothetical protein
MALRQSLILRSPRSGRLEGRTTLVQPHFVFFTRSKAGIYFRDGRRPLFPARAGFAGVAKSGCFSASQEMAAAGGFGAQVALVVAV